jgi:protein SCO1
LSARRQLIGLMTPARDTRRRARYGCAALVLAVVATACGGDNTDKTSGSPVIISGAGGDGAFAGAEPPTPYEMPDITLTATNEQPFNLVSDTSYPITLVFFGYTNCPDVCPLVMTDLTYTYLHLPADVRDDTQVLFITTDPARDTPEVLKGYVQSYDSNFIGLTGDLADIAAAAKAMGVPVTGENKLPSGGYDIGHGAQVIGFKGDEAPVIWTEGTPTTAMIADITKLDES